MFVGIMLSRRLISCDFFFNYDKGFQIFSPSYCFQVVQKTFSNMKEFLFFNTFSQAIDKTTNLFSSLYTRSLSVKFFVFDEEFFVDLGYSHFCLLHVPTILSLRCIKKKIYLDSMYHAFRNFVYLLNRLKKISAYKTKGIIYINRERYIKTKLGKKQQI